MKVMAKINRENWVKVETNLSRKNADALQDLLYEIDNVIIYLNGSGYDTSILIDSLKEVLSFAIGEEK